MSSKLAALKNAYEQKKTTTGGGDSTWKLFYPFWKMPDDTTATVRFLPDLDPDNPLQFLVENLQHELVINGEKKKVPCLSMFGEDCPICALSRQYYDEKNEELGKKYYRKKSYIGQCVVIESPFEHDQSQLVKLIEFGPQVFKQIQAAFASTDLDEVPYELKGGYNFRFRKTKTGSGQNSYTTSNFSPKQSDLDDELIAKLNLFNLADYRGKKPDVASVEAMLLAERTGQAFKENHSDAEPENLATKVVAEAKAAPEQAAPVVEQAPPAPAVGSGKSVLEMLRAKAKAAEASE